MYLPPELIPSDFEQADFDEFFRVMGMAQVARELRIEDMEIGVQNGCAHAFGEE